MDFLEKEILSVRTIRSEDYKKLPNTNLTYFWRESLFGNYIAAFYKDELCALKFYDSDLKNGLKKVQDYFKNAQLKYSEDFEPPVKLKLLMKGSDFEAAVWKELLKIERGATITYNAIATAVGNPNSVRAVGNAVGKNPVAYIVPCHRVIRKNGELGGFSSGPHRKLKMLHYEGAKF